MEKIDKILYVSRACPQDVYDKLEGKLGFAAVKFNRLLMEGFAANGIEVKNVMLNDSSFKNGIEKVESNDVQYICSPPLRLGSKIRQIFKLARQELKSNHSFLMCDYLCYVNSMVCLLAAKIKKRKSVCVVTDLPEHIVDYLSSDKYSIKEVIYIKLGYWILLKFDFHVLLTEAMASKIKSKNYIVIEGIVESSENLDPLLSAEKTNQILYAGTLRKVYGIDRLINAFVLLDKKNWNLKIYGDGDYKDEIMNISAKHSNVLYAGIADNKTILAEEEASKLLINPRLTKEDYTKYSFPSKNLEYMTSGTPLLTTNLPGMPASYQDYVYIFDDESEGGFKNTLNEVLSKPDCELSKKGKDARKFVLENKNKKIQSKKILDQLLRI